MRPSSANEKRDSLIRGPVDDRNDKRPTCPTKSLRNGERSVRLQLKMTWSEAMFNLLAFNETREVSKLFRIHYDSAQVRQT
jgi:hypothetical protein